MEKLKPHTQQTCPLQGTQGLNPDPQGSKAGQASQEWRPGIAPHEKGLHLRSLTCLQGVHPAAGVSPWALHGVSHKAVP